MGKGEAVDFCIGMYRLMFMIVWYLLLLYVPDTTDSSDQPKGNDLKTWKEQCK